MLTDFALKFARIWAIVLVQSYVVNTVHTANGTQIRSYGATIQFPAAAQKSGNENLKQAGQ